MQQFKFVIPQKLEDLLHPQEDPNVYYVNDELTSLEIAERLPQTEELIKQDPLNIEQEFSLFYSVLKNFHDLDPRIVERTWILSYKANNYYKENLREILSVVNETVASQTSHNQSQVNQSQMNASQLDVSCHGSRINLFESIQEKLKYSNSLKMLIFINCTFINLFEDSLSTQCHRQNFNESIGDTTTPAKRKKKQRTNNNGPEKSFKEYERYKERVTKDLLHLISMSLNRLAESRTEARDIASQVMKISYKMIENSGFNDLTKSKELLEINYSILGIGIERYRQSLSFCLKFIQLLQHREQLAPLLAELVEFIVMRHDQRLLIGEILREIDRIDIRDLSRDSSCPRAVSTFLVTLSERCPKEFIPSLDHMFGYLAQDSYIMRNASLAVMANIIIKVLHASEEDKQLRDDLLDALLAHIQDMTGYTRSKALSVWSTLCENQCIPLAYIVPVTKAAVGRLMDKSCFVRKNAVRFIISVLSRNPFAGKLPMKVFCERYEVEKQELERLIKEEEAKIEREEDVCDTLSQGSQDDTQEDINDSQMTEAGDEPSTPVKGSQPQDGPQTCLKVKDLALTEESAVAVQQRKVKYLEDAIAFTQQIHKAIPITTEMLTSKNVTDIQEAVDFFVHCHEFGIDEALIGFKRMILLISVQEKAVKDAISLAYQRIFFESSRYEGKSNRDSLVIGNFLNFILEASIGESISLEMLIGQFLDNQLFTKDMERELWARFTRAKANSTIEDAIGSIQLLGMLATYKPDTINHNLQLCLEFGLSNNGCSEQESRLVRETCIAIRKSLPRKIEDKRRFMRLAKNDQLFTRLTDILVESLGCIASEHWFSMCDEAMRIIFDMSENPDQVSESIFVKLSEKLLKNAVQSNTTPEPSATQSRQESPDLVFQPNSIQATGATITSSQTTTLTANHTMELVHPLALSRYIHFLGDIALNLAVFLELHVLLELKIRNASNTNGGDTSKNNISAHNISISNRRRSRRYGNANKSMDEQNLEEEIGLGGAEAEDAEMEFIGSICDEEVVCGKNLLAKLSRVIIEVVTDPYRYPNAELKQAASLALAKFMMVSAKYCNDHLRLLFTILEKTKESAIKINLLIAISDLCIRFPNQLDGWTSKIFDCLQSSDVAVRRAALKILSRLVLCDILKAKDQISTIANLIVDEDEQIASYSRHFFLELSKKLNAIYNVLPDIISRLSDSKTGISEENFRIVMKFMFELIDKSHHIDRLVDKLCGRFMDTDDERHWSDLAFCLSLLKYSDRSMVKLFDKFDCYKDKLCIDAVRDSISLTIANYRKTPHLKAEMKSMLDEFEVKIAKSVGEAQENSVIENSGEQTAASQNAQDDDVEMKEADDDNTDVDQSATTAAGDTTMESEA